MNQLYSIQIQQRLNSWSGGIGNSVTQPVIQLEVLIKGALK